MYYLPVPLFFNIFLYFYDNEINAFNLKESGTKGKWYTKVNSTSVI